MHKKDTHILLKSITKRVCSTLNTNWNSLCYKDNLIVSKLKQGILLVLVSSSKNNSYEVFCISKIHLAVCVSFSRKLKWSETLREFRCLAFYCFSCHASTFRLCFQFPVQVHSRNIRILLAFYSFLSQTQCFGVTHSPSFSLPHIKSYKNTYNSEKMFVLFMTHPMSTLCYVCICAG